MAVFGQSPAGIHIGIILVTSITTILIFFIGRELLGNIGGLLAAATFTCLSALAQSRCARRPRRTHFVSLFVLRRPADLAARPKKESAGCVVAGAQAFLFGLAILMKQHAVFSRRLFSSGICGKELRRDRRQKILLNLPSAFCGGCILPLLITAIGFACAGLWGKFIFWTFQYAHQYVSIRLPLRATPAQFIDGFAPVFTTEADLRSGF